MAPKVFWHLNVQYSFENLRKRGKDGNRPVVCFFQQGVFLVSPRFQVCGTSDFAIIMFMSPYEVTEWLSDSWSRCFKSSRWNWIMSFSFIWLYLFQHRFNLVTICGAKSKSFAWIHMVNVFQVDRGFPLIYISIKFSGSIRIQKNRVENHSWLEYTRRVIAALGLCPIRLRHETIALFQWNKNKWPQSLPDELKRAFKWEANDYERKTLKNILMKFNIYNMVESL